MNNVYKKTFLGFIFSCILVTFMACGGDDDSKKTEKKPTKTTKSCLPGQKCE
jgi:hypothetical protein